MSDDSSLVYRTRQLLRHTRELRDEVRASLKTGSFANTDVQMKAYNDLAGTAVFLFPDDGVLGSQLITMPDQVLRSFGTLFPVTSMPPAMPAERLDAHLTRLVHRLETVLGEAETPSASPTPQHMPELQSALESVQDLEKRQPASAPIEVRPFAFVADPQLRDVLVADFIEAQKAFVAGAYKACALLAGCLIEGMLLDLLQRPDVVSRSDYAATVGGFPKNKVGVNWNKVSLTDLIKAAVQLGFLPEAGTGHLALGARDFRDTVHPKAELRAQGRPKLEEAKILLAVAELFYRRLSGAP